MNQTELDRTQGTKSPILGQVVALVNLIHLARNDVDLIGKPTFFSLLVQCVIVSGW